MTGTICPICRATVDQSSQVCPGCGLSFLGDSQPHGPAVATAGKQVANDSRATAQSVLESPQAGTELLPARVSHRSWNRKRPWYRRKAFLIAVILLIVVGGGAAGALAYFNAHFAAVNAVSTPPSELSADRLGGEDNVSINTGPAQQAVRLAEEGQGEQGEAATSFDLETTMVSNSDGGPNRSERAITLDRIGDDNAGQVEPADKSANADDLSRLTGSQQQLSQPPSPDGAASVLTDPSLPASPERSGDSLTILLMGVDARPGEAIDVGVRPDTLALLYLDGETGSCRLLSIPRDTRTELPGYGLSKVNHALAVGGIPYQELVTEEMLGIEIDHYGLIDFSGVVELVNSVGGVTVTNDTAFTQEGISFDVGEITLDGEEALTYARFRNDEQGDFGRIDRQQQIIRALISQTSGMEVVTGANQLLNAVEGHVKTDLSPIELIGLANDFRSTCTDATLEADNLMGEVATHPDPLLNMPLSYVIVDLAEIESKVRWLTGEP